MGFFSWGCSCGHSIKAPYNLPEAIDWQADVVAMYENGTRIVGRYDGYGHIDDHEINHHGEVELWHHKCWKKAGEPVYSKPSPNAPDQGYFYDYDEEVYTR